MIVRAGVASSARSLIAGADAWYFSMILRDSAIAASARATEAHSREKAAWESRMTCRLSAIAVPVRFMAFLKLFQAPLRSGTRAHQCADSSLITACNLNQPTRLPVLVQRLDYCEAGVINEERVVAEDLLELRKRRVIVRDNLSVDLLQDRVQFFGT